MGKRVFMFPGQGSQYVGMGKGFYDSMPQVKEIFELASEKSGLDIPNLCFTENDKLNITEYTPVSYTHLDVYKRQVFDCTNTISKEQIDHIVSKLKNLKVPVVSIGYDMEGCLLYTSRCV